eukprot:15108923-Alexandrium_andersonii.AAC.1
MPASWGALPHQRILDSGLATGQAAAPLIAAPTCFDQVSRVSTLRHCSAPRSVREATKGQLLRDEAVLCTLSCVKQLDAA